MDHRKRAKRTGILLGAAALLGFLLLTSCKWGAPQYTLTVIIEEGVTGTPEAGQYTYEELATVDFDYTGTDPLTTVEVVLNDRIRNPGTGKIVMFDDGYELVARLVDVRGDWDIVMTYTDDPDNPVEFTLQIAGADILSGTFTDSLGHNGTWTGESNILTMAYWDWDFHILSQTVYDLGTKSGSFVGGGRTGTWTAKRPE